ncbi:uncharacterized protein LOC110985669 [Acanthaster planci]|uniref:Uncharacterized protein LOC110985669 n=1 Tax=Acanthaster planci TaxID=133434 RepID=A0A8B7ZC45_ACAPL|nr:uncharacterized protein LOC110985669 [Acanthaster planci]
MKYIAVLLVLLGAFAYLHKAEAVTGQSIANVALGYVGSTRWALTSSTWPGTNTNKCNIFVATVLEEAGASVPQRHWWTWSPIGANEWANSNSNYLTSSSCWTSGSGGIGNVAALGGHVGIVTSSSQTTSATATAVVTNDWGFRSGQSPVFWEYTC